MLDDVTISLRDLAYLMIAVSDNTAADALVARVGLDAVNTMLAGFGLGSTRVAQDCREILASMAEDTGAEWSFTDPDMIARLRVLDPARTNRSTPARDGPAARHDLAGRGGLGRSRAPGCAVCSASRSGRTGWPPGSPTTTWRSAARPARCPTIRNEAGVVEYPDGGRYAVAVFTRSFSTAMNQPRADAVIGTAARMAVDHLRR